MLISYLTAVPFYTTRVASGMLQHCPKCSPEHLRLDSRHTLTLLYTSHHPISLDGFPMHYQSTTITASDAAVTWQILSALIDLDVRGGILASRMCTTLPWLLLGGDWTSVNRCEALMGCSSQGQVIRLRVVVLLCWACCTIISTTIASGGRTWTREWLA